MRLVQMFVVVATLFAAFAVIGTAGHSAAPTTQAWPIWCCYPEH